MGCSSEKLQTLEDEKKDLQRKIVRLTNSLEEERNQFKNLQTIIQNNNTMFTQINETLNNLENEKKSLINKNANKEKALKDLNNKYRTLENRFKNMEDTKLMKENELEQLYNQLQQKNKIQKKMEFDYNVKEKDLLKKIRDAKNENEKKNRDLIKLQQDKKNLEIQHKKNIDIIDSLKGDYQELEEQLDEMGDKVNEYKNNCNNLKKELNEKNEHNKSLELKVENYLIEKKEFQEAIEMFEKDRQKKNSEIEKLEKKFSEVEKEKDLKADIINNLKLKKLTLENQVRNLQGNLLENEQKNLDMIKELENVNNQLNLEKNKKESLESALNKYQEKIEINNFYKEFESEIMQNKALEFLKNIKIDISKTIKNKFDTYFKNIILNEMVKDITNISQKENFKENFKKSSEIFYKKAIKEFSEKTKHLNILIIGKSGVGKSTLINAILKEDRAKTQLGRPCTEGINFYESENVRLWDSRGIELNEKNSLEKVLKETKELVKNNNNLGDPDKYIHCIWYCTTGQRFEEIEEKSVKQLTNLYNDNSLPLIIVYTLSLSKIIFDGMKDHIRKKIPKDVDILPVLAQDFVLEGGYTEKARGVGELVKHSINKFRNALDHVSFSTIRNLVIHMFDDSIINNNKIITQEIEMRLKSINSFEEAKSFLKNALNNFHTIITGQEIQELSNIIIKSSIDNWSTSCKSEIESYSNSLMKETKENFRKLYLNELQKYKNYKNVKTEEVDDSRNQILYCNNIINEIENTINEEKNDFIIKKIVISIFHKYMDIISVVIKNNVQAIIEDGKKEIILLIQKEIDSNENFNNIFGLRRNIPINNYFIINDDLNN